METIKKTIAENFGGKAHDLAPEGEQFSLEQVPNLEGKVAVITGGSEGIVSLSHRPISTYRCKY